MKKRILSMALALSMCLTLLPTNAFALATPESADGGDTAVCICETQCTEGEVNPDCPVCGADSTQCKGTEKASSEANSEEQPQEDQEVTAAQELIDALPTAEEIAEMDESDKENVSEALDAIDEAMAGFTEEQVAALDMAAYDAAYTALTENTQQVATYAAGDITPTAPTNGNGTEESPYEITSAAELYWFAATVNNEDGSGVGACAKLMNDIMVNEAVLGTDGAPNEGEFVEWTPIVGSGECGYTGTFDGQSNTIKGLYYSEITAMYVGLFGYNASGTIKNVTLADSYFKGDSYVGGVCGYNGGTIQNCANSSTVSGKLYIGGVCGANDGEITTSRNSGAVGITLPGEYEQVNDVGGVCGLNDSGRVTNCANSGTVSVTLNGEGATAYQIGGVCGKNAEEGTVQSCISTASVSVTGVTTTAIGSVCGVNQGAVDNCYFYGDSACGTSDVVDDREYEKAPTHTEGKTSDEFASGEVAWLLNGSWSDDTFTPGATDGAQAWYQNLTEGGDPAPVPVKADGNTVYFGRGYDKDGFLDAGSYSNTEFKSNATIPYQAPEKGAGTEASPYEIANAGNLYWFAAKVNGTDGITRNKNACATLVGDITVNEAVLAADGTPNNGDGFRAWTPIGNDDYPYYGTFDGRGYTICGLYLNKGSMISVGLFGCNAGIIKNVTLADSYFKGNAWVGGLCGYNVNGTIQNCANRGTVVGNLSVGGVCGESIVRSGSTAQIANCTNSGAVSGTEDVGGVCGCNGGASTIENCANSGAVSGTDTASSKIGGVCGKNDGSAENCYSIGEVSNKNTRGYTGGVSGSNTSSATIRNCYYNSKVYTGKPVGYEGAAPTHTEGKDDKAFASGEVAWLLNGSWSDDTFTPGATDGNQAWYQNLAEGGDPAPVPVKADGNTVYFGGHYDADGFLVREYANTVLDSSVTCPYQAPEGEGSKESPYKIANAGNLYWFAARVNGTDGITRKYDSYAYLTNNITVNKNVLDENGNLNTGDFRSWTPIGSSNNIYYKGTFNGGGYTIYGLYLNKDSMIYVGLFGHNRGTIQNVTVADSYISGKMFVGGVCGQNIIGTMQNVTLDKSYISGIGQVGGVCGQNQNGTIRRCNNYGVVTGRDSMANAIGGVCGCNYSYYETNAIITECINSGMVQGKGDNCFDIGGICGINQKITSTSKPRTAQVTRCINTGIVSCDSIANAKQIGGVCGNNFADKANYAIIKECINNGKVLGAETTTRIGGVCGYNQEKVLIDNCYNNEDSCNEAAIGDSATGATDTNTGNKAAAEFTSGVVAWLLNSTAGTEKNSSFWSQGKVTPVFADKENTPIYRALFVQDNENRTTLKAQYLKAGEALDPPEWDFEWEPTLDAAMPAADTTYMATLPTATITDNEKYTTINTYNATELADPVAGDFTANEGAGELSYEWYAGNPVAEGATALTSNPSDAGTYTLRVIAAPTDAFKANTLDVKVEINKLNITGATVGTFEKMTYTGSEQTPKATVTKDSFAVTGSWSKVTNVTDKTTFTASGNFTGTIENQATEMAKKTVDALDLTSLVTAPAKGAVPQSTFEDQTQYTGAIAWTGAPTKFLGGTAYTATLTLAPTANYTFTGLAANKFTYTDATVTNAQNGGTVTIVFPKTADRVLSGISVKTAPSKKSYTYGESFAASGLVLTLTYDDESTAEVAYSDETASKFSFAPETLTAATTEVTVTYEGKTATISGISVSKATVTAPTVTKATYNGAKQTAAVTANEKYNITNNGGTNAGNYDVVLTLKDAANYKWNSGDEDNDGKITLTFTIDPLNISDATVGAFGLTYTGSEQIPKATVTKNGQTATGTWSAVTDVADKTTFTANGNFTGTIANQATSMAKKIVDALALTSLVTAPTKNGTPQATFADQTQYTGAIAWTGAPTKFLGGTAYTATVTLAATANYTFTGLAENKFTYTGATVTNAKDSGIVTIVFPKTADRVVSEIAITGSPEKTAYEAGEAFAPAGLTITATYDDDTTAVITTGYTVTPDPLTVGTTSVSISFGGKSASVSGISVSQNTTYNIAYNGNGATSGSMQTTKNVSYSEEITLPANAFKKTGYAFVEWNTKADGSGTAYKNKATVKRLTKTDGGTRNLYAIWKENTYTISYSLDGGTNSTSNPGTYTVTSSTITLKNPSKKGYTFAGWYKDSAFKTKTTQITKGSTGNRTLYAKWTKNSYKIAFNGNGSTSGSMTTLNCRYASSYTLTANTFKKTGYTFAGWNTKADGSGTAYADKATVKNLTSTNGATRTLYATWKRNTYTIKYNLDGGTNSSSNPTKYYVTSSTITLKNPSKKGYTFAGWYKESTFKTKVTQIAKGSTGTKTLYAKWTLNSYKIAFDGNGSTSGSMTTLNCRYGSSYTLTANKFKKTGYTFAGWNTKADGSGTAYADKATVKSLTSTNGATRTLYATWQEKTYTIKYNLDGGTNNTSNPTKYTVTSSTITLKTPKRAGYTFQGWYKESTFKTKVTKIIAGSTGTQTLYAKWSANA